MSVYFFGLDCDPLVKIGFSEDPLRRLHKAQSDCPYPLRLLAIVDGGEETEAAFHAEFASFHYRGEWFRLSPEIQSVIDANKWEAPARDAGDSEMRTIRFALNLSQAELAEKLGIHQTAVSRFESGNLAMDRRTELAMEALKNGLRALPS
jgi:DNA-binding transcriptional regulator YiaG